MYSITAKADILGKAVDLNCDNGVDGEIMEFLETNNCHNLAVNINGKLRFLILILAVPLFHFGRLIRPFFDSSEAI